MRSLIWALAVRICPNTRFRMVRPIWMSFQVSPWKRYRNDILECVDVIVHFTKANRTKHSDPINLANLLDQCCKPEHVRQELWDRFVTMTSQHTGTATEEDIICFVIDDNMYYRSMRHKYYQLARKCMYCGLQSNFNGSNISGTI